jgi:hypothetical protein
MWNIDMGMDVEEDWSHDRTGGMASWAWRPDSGRCVECELLAAHRVLTVDNDTKNDSAWFTVAMRIVSWVV